MSSKTRPPRQKDAMPALLFPVPTDTPVSQSFGENPALYQRFGLSGHNGLDFACPPGTPVRAAAAGLCARRGDDPHGYGLFILLEHTAAGGLRYATLYAHLQAAAVAPGQTAQAGEVVGLSGNSGFSSGPHLHFELRLDGKAVDPAPFFAAQPPGPAPQAGAEQGISSPPDTPPGTEAAPSQAAEPAMASLADPSAFGSGGSPALARQTLRIRSAPSTSGATLGALPAGAAVCIFRLLRRGADVWALISPSQPLYTIYRSGETDFYRRL